LKKRGRRFRPRPVRTGIALVCGLLAGLLGYVLFQDHLQRSAANLAAQAATVGKLGGAWMEFQTQHGSLPDGRFNAIDCKRTRAGHYVLVEDGAVKMIGMDFDYGGIIEPGIHRQQALAAAERFLPGDARFLEQEEQRSDLDPRHVTHIALYEAESLAALFPDTDWRDDAPGSFSVTMSEVGPTGINPEDIDRIFIQFRLVGGRYPSTTGKSPSSSPNLGPPVPLMRPWGTP
jgi:hypothetical protein